MRYIFAIMFLLAAGALQAQVTGTAQPPADKVDEYSEWVTATYTLKDNTEIEFEYRIKLVKKKGMACHYEMEFKNNSDRKLNFAVMFTYYDQLVKQNMSDATKVKVKGGASGTAKLIAQGCKKKKDAEKKDDYSVCTACGMTYEIVVGE